MKWNMLVVTDHSTHNETNSLYQLCHALSHDPRCQQIWVCSRGVGANKDFFDGTAFAPIFASPVTAAFDFDKDGMYFHTTMVRLEPDAIDTIMVRMPQPFDKTFLMSLEKIVDAQYIINSPEGIVETATKEFLLQIPHLCPPSWMCHSMDEALVLSREEEIVLKPLLSYGGRGIVRLSRDFCWNGNDRFPIDQLTSFLSDEQFPMLAMRFLKNVTLGDKRTVVVHKQILGSALRMPAPGSWMCNVAQGGHAVYAEPDEDEHAIEQQLTPLLYQKGVIMYGFDTLVNDDGRRVLSEINTLSIGGLMPLEELTGRPILSRTASLIWDNVGEKK